MDTHAPKYPEVEVSLNARDPGPTILATCREAIYQAFPRGEAKIDPFAIWTGFQREATSGSGSVAQIMRTAKAWFVVIDTREPWQR